jgi:hypothetical protein
MGNAAVVRLMRSPKLDSPRFKDEPLQACFDDKAPSVCAPAARANVPEWGL